MYNESICLRCNVSAASYKFDKNKCVVSGCETHSDSGYDNHYDSGYDNYSNNYYYHSYAIMGYTYNESKCSDTGCETHRDSGCETHSNSGYDDYSNCTNACYVQWTYGNYGNDSAPNRGSPYSVSWGASWSGDALIGTYIADSESGIKELRDKIKSIADNKGRNKVSDSLVTTTNSSSGNATFDAGEKIEDIQFLSLRNTLENLFQDLKQSSSSIPIRAEGDRILKSDFTIMKQKVDELAGSTISYANCNHSGYSNNSGYNNTGAPNSSYVDSSVCTQYSNAASYTNHKDVRYS